MWNVQNEWCLDVTRDIIERRLHTVAAQRWPAESDLRRNVAPNRLGKKRNKKQKTKLSDRFIEDVCHCRFYPASRLSSGAIWGLFFLLVEVISPPSCYKKHTHTKILLDKNSHPFAKKKKKKSHHTRYGHTNERTTIQIFMKCFPNGNI